MTDEPDPRLISLREDMARACAAGAPGDWRRAVLECHATRLGAGGELAYERPGGRDRSRSADMRHLLSALTGLVGDPGLRVEMELAVEPSGRYEMTVTRRGGRELASDGADHLCVLDPYYRPPEPGEEQEGPADATPAGDPDEAVRLLREFMRREDEILGYEDEDRAEEVGRPTTERIEEVERSIGVALPADLRALYEAVEVGGAPFHGHAWLTLDQLERCADDPGRRWFGWRLDWNLTILDASPPETVRRSSWEPHWIPFAEDGGGNFLAVDMNPARSGRPGQVVQMGRDFDAGPLLVAGSVTDLLRRQIAALDRGDYRADSGYLAFLGEEWDESAILDARVWRGDATEFTPGAVRPELQQLIVWRRAGNPVLDLEVLRPRPGGGAPLLRDLRVHCRVADLDPLRELPVETLHLDTDPADLAPLAGHPTLRRLTLKTRRPVDIGALATLPRLDGLDLSGAAVSGLEVAAGLAGLRLLALAHQQWQDLRAHTDRLPPLAAARLSGDVRRGQVLLWAKRLAGDPASRTWRHTGTL